ncbi:venom protein 302-like [Oratosquilla oratoria]|uniref:venom protein 302-like n=1 Tax=Oratosquilla oratoria TaxID=337810 RepID=UPI003F7740D8
MTRSTSTLVLLLALLCIFVSVKRSSGLTCFPCEDRKNCRNEPNYCTWGFTKGICGCCVVCAKGPGQKCGGDFNLDGTCAPGLTCVSFGEWRYHGICVKVPSIPWGPDSSEEDNSSSSESNES